MNAVLESLAADRGIRRHSNWMQIDQAMIDRFADATLDHQFIHIDPIRAAETSFGGTVAHGFLTLSLMPILYAPLVTATVQNAKMLVNYGFERMRFVHPVRSGSRIRAGFTLIEVVEKRPGQLQQSHEVIVEIEGVEKPALTATWLTQFLV